MKVYSDGTFEGGAWRSFQASHDPVTKQVVVNKTDITNPNPPNTGTNKAVFVKMSDRITDDVVNNYKNLTDSELENLWQKNHMEEYHPLHEYIEYNSMHEYTRRKKLKYSSLPYTNESGLKGASKERYKNVIFHLYAKDSNKGSYRIVFNDGSMYVGEGDFGRCKTSMNAKTNQYPTKEITTVYFFGAHSKTDGYIKEYVAYEKYKNYMIGAEDRLPGKNAYLELLPNDKDYYDKFYD